MQPRAGERNPQSAASDDLAVAQPCTDEIDGTPAASPASCLLCARTFHVGDGRGAVLGLLCPPADPPCGGSQVASYTLDFEVLVDWLLLCFFFFLAMAPPRIFSFPLHAPFPI